MQLLFLKRAHVVQIRTKIEMRKKAAATNKIMRLHRTTKRSGERSEIKTMKKRSESQRHEQQQQ